MTAGVCCQRSVLWATLGIALCPEGMEGMHHCALEGTWWPHGDQLLGSETTHLQTEEGKKLFVWVGFDTCFLALKA